MKNRFSGKFIVLDGPDGCGKSTQAAMLSDWLGQQDTEVVMFRDPGTTVIGEKIRQILLAPEHDVMSTRTELLLYMAARAQLWAEKIKPALDQNKCVILDRWLSSTCAYQGYAGGFGIDKVLKIAADCLERYLPDLTIILDVGIETSSTRLNAELDRMEQKGDEYHKKVRQGFLTLAEERSDFVVVDASQEIEAVHKRIVEFVNNYWDRPRE
ncbi:MAG: dTMP kinase [Planctomycetota bacterium]